MPKYLLIRGIGGASILASSVYTYMSEDPTLGLILTTTSMLGTGLITYFCQERQYCIRGQVRIDGAPVAGATVNLSGARAETKSNVLAAGYSFTDLIPGQHYTVAATLDHHDIASAGWYTGVVNADKRADFDATRRTHTIRGQIRVNGKAVSGATVALSGAAEDTRVDVPKLGFEFADLLEGEEYKVEATLKYHDVVAAGFVEGELDADKTANFAATRRTHAIRGQIRVDGQAVSGANVELSGAAEDTRLDVPEDGFEFTDLLEGEVYQVEASLKYHDVVADDVLEGELDADKTANFAATRRTHAIRGQIRMDGKAVSGATVELSGAAEDTQLDVPEEGFEFADLLEGEVYRVEASLKYHDVVADDVLEGELDEDKTAGFLATRRTHEVHGSVKIDGAGRDGVKVTVSLGNEVVGEETTAGGGLYRFPDLEEGARYMVSIAPPYVTMEQRKQRLPELLADREVSFSGSTTKHSITGHIRELDMKHGQGLRDVVVTLSDGVEDDVTFKTKGDGKYAFPDRTAGRNHTLTLLKTHVTFDPPDRRYEPLAQDENAVITATLRRHAIRGRIRDDSGKGIAKVAVKTVGRAPSESNRLGNYEIVGLTPGAAYTLTPELEHHVFDPGSRTIDALEADVEGADFTISRIKYSISGTAVPPDNNPEDPVSVSLWNSRDVEEQRVVAVGPGYAYAFDDLLAGEEYRVEPYKKYTSFAPFYWHEPLVQNEVQNFVGTGVSYHMDGDREVLEGFNLGDGSGHMGLSEEMGLNLEGRAWPSHRVPVDVLIACSRIIKGRDISTDEGGGDAYYFSINGQEDYVCVICPRGSKAVIITCYRTDIKKGPTRGSVRDF